MLITRYLDGRHVRHGDPGTPYLVMVLTVNFKRNQFFSYQADERTGLKPSLRGSAGRRGGFKGRGGGLL